MQCEVIADCDNNGVSVPNTIWAHLPEVEALTNCEGVLTIGDCPAPPEPEPEIPVPTLAECETAWEGNSASETCDPPTFGIVDSFCRVDSRCLPAWGQHRFPTSIDAVVGDVVHLHNCDAALHVGPCDGSPIEEPPEDGVPGEDPPPAAEPPNADEECEDEWTNAQAAQSCGASSVTATETDEHGFPLECSVEATCPTEEQEQVDASITVSFDELHFLSNCNGLLRLGDCHTPYRPPQPPNEPCASHWYNGQASYQCFDVELTPIGDGGPHPEQCELVANCQNLHSGDGGPNPELVPNELTVDLFDLGSLQVCHGQLQVSGWCDPSQPPEPPPFDGTCEEGWPESPAASSCTQASVISLDNPPHHCEVEASCPDADGMPKEASIMIVLDEIVNLENCNGDLYPGPCPSGSP